MPRRVAYSSRLIPPYVSCFEMTARKARVLPSNGDFFSFGIIILSLHFLCVVHENAYLDKAMRSPPPLHRFRHPFDKPARRQSDAMRRRHPPWMLSHCRPAAFLRRLERFLRRLRGTSAMRPDQQRPLP